MGEVFSFIFYISLSILLLQMLTIDQNTWADTERNVSMLPISLMWANVFNKRVTVLTVVSFGNWKRVLKFQFTSTLAHHYHKHIFICLHIILIIYNELRRPAVQLRPVVLLIHIFFPIVEIKCQEWRFAVGKSNVNYL